MSTNLGRITKQQRISLSLTQWERVAKSGVSASHLGRIERGVRFYSTYILNKIAKPLNFKEDELVTLAGYLSRRSSVIGQKNLTHGSERLDPYVAKVLAQEPVEEQHTVIGILTVLSIASPRGYQCNIEFAEYAHRKFSELDEDIITMFEESNDASAESQKG